jgi:NDP-sugar pyrophosphorylase family protein
MAKGIILPSGRAESFKPLTYQMPVGLLPLVNKAIMEHQVEFLVRNGVKSIRLSCNHLSNKVESYFDTGTRWGATISYNFERPPFGFLPALRQMRQYYQGDTLVIMDSDVLSDIDLQAAIAFHVEHRADATFLCLPHPDASASLDLSLDDRQRVHAVRTHQGSAATHFYMDAGICIIEPGVFDFLAENVGYNLLQSCWLTSQKVTLNLYGYPIDHRHTRIFDWKTHAQVQRDILDGKYPGVQIPGIQVSRRVWVGKNVTASSNVSFVAPIVIGDNCRIGKGVSLGTGTVVGHDVMIEAGTVMKHATVMPNTFVGSQMALQDAIITGNVVIDLERNSFSAINDRLSASEIQRGGYGMGLYNAINRMMGALLCVLLAPFVALLFVGLLVGIKLPLISRIKRIGVDLQDLEQGKLHLRVFDLHYFGPIDTSVQVVGYNPDPVTILPNWLARLGNLMNVARGDLILVGNRPMDPELAFSVTEEWRRTRLKCQSGFISVLDTNDAEGMSDEEKVIAEVYYAANKTIRMDLSILFGVITRLVGRLLGRGKVTRTLRHVTAADEPPLLN